MTGKYTEHRHQPYGSDLFVHDFIRNDNLGG